MPEKHPNLAAALAAFQGEMPTIAKAKRAEVPTKTGGKYTYTYAGLADVVEAAMPALTRHGLAFISRPRSGLNGYELRGVLLHESGEKLTGDLPIRGATPQEIGSSLTYMRRYLFGCLTGVVTEDDDDGAAASRAPRRPTEQSAQPARESGTRRMSRHPIVPERTITEPQSRAMHAAFTQAGIDGREHRLAYCRKLIARDIESSNDLTSVEASRVLDALRQDAEPEPVADVTDAQVVEEDPEEPR